MRNQRHTPIHKPPMFAVRRVPAFTAPKQTRSLNIHEYCGMDIMKKSGIPVPSNLLCRVRTLSPPP